MFSDFWNTNSNPFEKAREEIRNNKQIDPDTAVKIDQIMVKFSKMHPLEALIYAIFWIIVLRTLLFMNFIYKNITMIVKKIVSKCGRYSIIALIVAILMVIIYT